MGEVGLPGRAVDAVYNYLLSGASEAPWLRWLFCAFVNFDVSSGMSGVTGGPEGFVLAMVGIRTGLWL